MDGTVRSNIKIGSKVMVVQKQNHVLALIQYIAEEDKDEKVLENQQILLTPIVRNGKKATVGYLPEVWKTWE